MDNSHKPVLWRYRTDWRGRLILQTCVDPLGNTSVERIGDFAVWRDAMAQDITRTDVKAPAVPLRAMS